MIEPRDFELQLPQGYISVSQINLYLSCARRYHYRYVRKFRGRSGSGLVMGRAVHKIVEKMLSNYMASDFNRLPSAEFVDDTISDSLPSYVRDVDVWENEFEEAEDKKGDFDTMARELSHLFRVERLPDLHPRAVEYKFETEIGGMLPLLGFIDIIDRDLDEDEANGTADTDEPQPYDTIRDLKVTGKKYGENRVNNSLQLSLYAGAIKVYKTGYDLLVKRGTGKKSVHRVIPQPAEEPGYAKIRTQDEIDWAVNIALDAAEGISAGYFPRCDPESWMCCEKWCDHFSRCRGKKG